MQFIRQIFTFILCSLLVSGWTPYLFAQSPSSYHTDYQQSKNSKCFAFVENKGQITDQYHNPRNDIQFQLKAASGLNIFIGIGTIHYQFSENKNNCTARPWQSDVAEPQHPPVSMYRMDVSLIDANPHAQIITEQQQDYFENYFTAETNGQLTTAHTFNKITYKDIYPGIDWVIYINQGTMEHEFVVNDGANAKCIKLQYYGANSLKINADGSFTATTPQGIVSENMPVSYQKDGKTVATKYHLTGNILSYDIAPCSQLITIDPTVEWSTYYGGSSTDLGLGVTTDSFHNVYTTGKTSSVSGIATIDAYNTTYGGGYSNAYLAKFNASGSLIWATYYGGNGEDEGNNVTTDIWGDVYITGFTTSASGIATTGAYQPTFAGGAWDAFVAKFNGSGAIQWGTYYGGSDADYGYGIATDHAGNVFITGATTSTSGISTSGAYQTTIGGGWDAFAAKFSTGGTMQWATYYGGSAWDFAQGAAVDNLGNVYFTGSTASSAAIATSGAYQTAYGGGTYDVFITKFDNNGVLQWGTYYGGSGNDEGNSVATDIPGNVYVTGFTNSTMGIATAGAYENAYQGGKDAFITKFNSIGNLQWGTYFGGDSDEVGSGISTDNQGFLYITGSTASTSDIATPGAYQTTYGGGINDAFLAQFNNAGIIQWASYFGGAGSDVGINTATDNNGYIYTTGNTNSSSSIATSGAYQTTLGGGIDAFLFQIKGCTPSVGLTGPDTVCFHTTISVSASSAGGIWSATNGLASVSNGIVTGFTPGVDTICYTITNVCGTTVATHTVEVSPIPTVAAVSNQTYCSGTTTSPILFSGTTGAIFSWTNSNTGIGLCGNGFGNIFAFTTTNPGLSAEIAVFNVTPEIGSCIGAIKSFTITVNATPSVNTVSNKTFCNGTAVPKIIFSGTSGATILWKNRNTTIGVAANGNTAIAAFTATDMSNTAAIAVITVTPSTSLCVGASKTFTITVYPTPVVSPVASDTFCSGLPTPPIIFSGDPMTVFHWTNFNTVIGLKSHDTGNIRSFIAINRDTVPISATFSVTPVIGTCVGASQTFTLTINPMPTVTASIPNQMVCNDSLSQPINFSGTIPGTVFSWINTDDTPGLAPSGTGNIPVFTAINSGTAPAVSFIIVTPRANNCNGTSQTFSIKINPTTSVSILAGPDTVCKGAMIMLIDSVVGGVWSSYDTNIASVTNGMVSGLDSGIDNIYYTIANACGFAEAIKVVTITECENHPVIPHNLFGIYPNPFVCELTISSSVTINKVDIFDVIGQKVFSNEYNDSYISLNLDALADAVYILRLNGQYVYKIVKK